MQRVKVGTAKRFAHVNRKSLLRGVKTILQPEYAARAREISTRMSDPADAVATAADLLEEAVRVNA